jgi:peptidyl-prolyl cis-trans isomerase SurA
VTDREVEERFRSRPAEFGDGASKIGHILIRTSDSRGQPLPPAQVRKARDDAEDVHRRLSRGEDFAQLAIALSQDSATAANGGLLGWGDALPNLPEEVRLAAAGLEPGQISRPVRSGQGWHVVKVTERRRVSWEEARPGVLSKIVNERRRKLLGELEKAARIEPGPAGL